MLHVVEAVLSEDQTHDCLRGCLQYQKLNRRLSHSDQPLQNKRQW